MGEAIGQMLPTAVGVAISPLPIVAVVLMLVTPRGKVNGMAFVIGWIIGLTLVGAIVLAAAIAQTGIPAGEQAGAYAIFVVVASLGVALPVVVALALGARSRGLLGELKDWLATSNATIMAVLMVVIGSKLIGDAISGF